MTGYIPESQIYPVSTINANIDGIIAEMQTLMLFTAEFAVTSGYTVISAAAETAAQALTVIIIFLFSFLTYLS